MSKELKIDIPEGYEIDKENSTFERIVFKKKYTYPKSWEEFCKNEPTTYEEYYISLDSHINKVISDDQPRNYNGDRNLCKTEEEAEAFLALMQLKRLWHEYVDNYPEKVDDCYCITCVCSSNGNDFSILYIGSATYNMDLFKFPSKELAEEFLYNFKDLFMKISPLWN